MLGYERPEELLLHERRIEDAPVIGIVRHAPDREDVFSLALDRTDTVRHGIRLARIFEQLLFRQLMHALPVAFADNVVLLLLRERHEFRDTPAVEQVEHRLVDE